MASDDIQITYNHSLAAVEEVLRDVKRPGDYFCAGTHETPIPSLSVEGVGAISFPVPAGQAREMIARAAERAPYGRGDRTLVDDNVRRVWQISPGKVTLRGKGWERSFDELIGRVAEGLGCEAGGVAAEFYKLLVYEAGGHFAAHRDTEKLPGMFGTLVVALPSAHRGGNLVIRHGDRETSVSLTGDDPGEVRYAAFYADCEHEVRPVAEGHRVCLVYNLVYKARNKIPRAPDNLPAVEAVADILDRWAVSAEDPLKLVYLLEHHYTQAALSFADLKRGDAARAWVLREAAALSGCALHLGIVHIEESGWAEHFQDYGRHYEDEDDDEEEAADFTIGEVCDGLYYIDQWRNADDEAVSLGRIPLGDKEILPHGALEGEKPDQSHFSEATGNEGASFERTYLRAAFVLWPADRFDEVCISGGLDAAISRLGQLVADAKRTNGSGGAESERVSRFMELFPRDWPQYEARGERLAALFGHLADFGDPNLILAGAERVPLRIGYDSRLNEALLACAAVLGPRRSAKFFPALFETSAARQPASFLDLWRRLAERFPAGSAVLVTALEALIVEVAKAGAATHQTPHRFSRHWEGHEFPKDPRLAAVVPSPRLLADFLAAVCAKAGVDHCLRFLDVLRENPALYPPETLLLPCLEHIAREGTGFESSVSARLREQCAAYYLNRSAAPPEKPKDWAQPAEIRGVGKSPQLRELEAFARDPHAREHRFRVRKDLREEIHRAIDAAGLDMAHVTERKGSPQTLVCTKTRATYERARRQYESDLIDMRRLLALQIVEAPAPRATTEQLRKALDREEPG